MISKTCEVCGRKFCATYPRQRAKTCSEECAKKHKRNKNNAWARKKYREKKGLAGPPPEHEFSCPWASGSITAPECLGVDPWLGF